MPLEEIIIADSSPLIGLARIAMLPLLPKLARRIVVPPAVRLEITEAKQAQHPSTNHAAPAMTAPSVNCSVAE